VIDVVGVACDVGEVFFMDDAQTFENGTELSSQAICRIN